LEQIDKNIVIDKLKTLTKAELLDVFEDLLDNNYLSFDGLNKYFSCESKTTPTEEEIKQKIIAEQKLTDNELATISNALKKAENRKIGNIIKAKSSFVGFLLGRKLQHIFEQCWKIYPRKVGKQQGAKAFIKLFNDIKYKDLTITAQYILNKIIEYKNECERDCKEEQYIMHFATFCNSKKYL